MTGVSIGFEPQWIDGLHLGFDRSFYTKWSEFDYNLKELFVTTIRFDAPPDPEEGLANDEFDQLASATARWTFPEVGFEPYIELAYNDFGFSVLGPEPEHSRAIMLGFTKIFDISPSQKIAMTMEHTTLGFTRTSLVRPTLSYYMHSITRQGYTHQGQIIGSGIGPGSHTTNLFIRFYKKNVMHGFLLNYIRFYDDYYYENFDATDRHDYEVSLGYNGVFHISNFRLETGLIISRRQNLHFIKGNDVYNLQLSVGVTPTQLFDF